MPTRTQGICTILNATIIPAQNDISAGCLQVLHKMQFWIAKGVEILFLLGISNFKSDNTVNVALPANKMHANITYTFLLTCIWLDNNDTVQRDALSCQFLQFLLFEAVLVGSQATEKCFT